MEGVSPMRKSFVAAGAFLLWGLVGDAQEKPTVHLVIQAAPEQIKKAALAMFVRTGYSLDSDTTSELKISKPFTTEETDSYNTAHWTNPPVANCRRVHAFLLSPADHAVSVTMVSETVCHTDGLWLIRRDPNEKEIQFMQNTLADLKAKIEEMNQRR
jgi:hypothetical protein